MRLFPLLQLLDDLRLRASRACSGKRGAAPHRQVLRRPWHRSHTAPTSPVGVGVPLHPMAPDTAARLPCSPHGRPHCWHQPLPPALSCSGTLGRPRGASCLARGELPGAGESREAAPAGPSPSPRSPETPLCHSPATPRPPPPVTATTPAPSPPASGSFPQSRLQEGLFNSSPPNGPRSRGGGVRGWLDVAHTTSSRRRDGSLGWDGGEQDGMGMGWDRTGGDSHPGRRSAGSSPSSSPCRAPSASPPAPSTPPPRSGRPRPRRSPAPGKQPAPARLGPPAPDTGQGGLRGRGCGVGDDRGWRGEPAADKGRPRSRVPAQRGSDKGPGPPPTPAPLPGSSPAPAPAPPARSSPAPLPCVVPPRPGRTCGAVPAAIFRRSRRPARGGGAVRERGGGGPAGHRERGWGLGGPGVREVECQCCGGPGSRGGGLGGSYRGARAARWWGDGSPGGASPPAAGRRPQSRWVLEKRHPGAPSWLSPNLLPSSSPAPPPPSPPSPGSHVHPTTRGGPPADQGSHSSASPSQLWCPAVPRTAQSRYPKALTPPPGVP